MPEFDLLTLVAEVVRSPKYAQIAPEVVTRIANQELPRHRKLAEAVKATRTKLHQSAGAYLNPNISYAQLSYNLGSTNPDNLRIWAGQAITLHASTAERLPFLQDFYVACLANIPPPRVILDLACGFNPFTFPWQPGYPQATYLACDIVLPMLELVNQFLRAVGNDGKAFTCDLTSETPKVPSDLVLLMKTIPLLDQVDRQIAPRLLAELQTDHILVTFPGKSLGGRSKGMLKTYAARMQELVSDGTFEVTEHLFPNEIAYLLSRKSNPK